VFVNGIPGTSSILNVTAPLPAAITLASALANGSFQITLTNTPGASFTVLGAGSLALPASNWTVLGSATEISPGQFQFTDSQAANYPHRFYRLRSP